MLSARTRGGWAGDRPALSDKQFEEIGDTVRGRVHPQLAKDFRFHLRQVYAQAVEDSLLLRDLRFELAQVLKVSGPLPKLQTLIHRQVMQLRQDAAAGRPAAIQDSECLRRVLIAHAFLSERLVGPASAASQVDERVRAGWYTTARLLATFEDLNLAVTQGRDWFIPRQIVRGLAALMRDLTGSLPGRTYRSRDRSPDDFGERGWFHMLCNQVAGYVYDALPADARPERRPSCQRIVREELKALERELKARGSPTPGFLSQFPQAN